MTAPSVPPPGGGAMGVLANSGLMSSMNFKTVCCAEERLDLTAAWSSPFGGIPRSALSMFAASGEFTHQLIQATAASGFLVLAEADQSMLALYQALRSVALPVRLGNRRILISLPDAALTASS